MFVNKGIQLMLLDSLPLSTCRETTAKSQAICELGTWMLARFPESMRGPIEGIANLALAGGLLLVAWLLLKPLFASTQPAGKTPSNGN